MTALGSRSRVYLGLGSNLGDREQHIRLGLDRLSAVPESEIRSVSSMYESQAHTADHSQSTGAYLNCVAAIVTGLEPHALLAHCLTIERLSGRVRRDDEKWTARTLDIDILVFGKRTIMTRSLMVPHPQMTRRRFVLAPLAEIAADLYVTVPVNRLVYELLDRCDDQHEVELYPRPS